MNPIDKLIDSYFESWLKHDASILQDIFVTNCKYDIKGKRTIIGLRELREYWERNKSRQHSIHIFKSIRIEDGADSSRVAFCATFLDSEERQRQTIFGEICFQFDQGKISELSECYSIHREVTHYFFWEFISKSISYVSSGFNKIIQNHVPKIVSGASLISGVVLLYFSYHISKLPDFMVCALNGEFVPPLCDVDIGGDRDSMLAVAYRNLSIVVGLVLLCVPILSLYSARLRFGRVRTTELNRSGHDLELMRESFKSAQGLTIFSGDFSFVKDNAEFLAIFKRIASREGLNIISDSSREKVVLGLGGTADAAALVQQLEEQNKIRFGSPTPIKCSIVRKWDGSEVLYRFDAHGAGAVSSHLYMCQVKRRGDIGPVVDLIEHLSKAHLRGA
ncbi:hypothetical protein [Microcoleus sp.]|uniref:hypothetical protein n=1 Tax=Microcoleus sp. TaxID=44472 RepID=UPI00352480AD